jgi:hypothetical protein
MPIVDAYSSRTLSSFGWRRARNGVIASRPAMVTPAPRISTLVEKPVAQNSRLALARTASGVPGVK